MVHKYTKKGKKKNYTQAQKKELIAKYKTVEGEVSVARFSRENGIPAQTFRDWLAAEDAVAGSRHTTGLSPKIEHLLVLLMVMLSASGVPMGKDMLPTLGQKGINAGAIKVNPKIRFRNNKPGKD